MASVWPLPRAAAWGFGGLVWPLPGAAACGFAGLVWPLPGASALGFFGLAAGPLVAAFGEFGTVPFFAAFAADFACFFAALVAAFAGFDVVGGGFFCTIFAGPSGMIGANSLRIPALPASAAGARCTACGTATPAATAVPPTTSAVSTAAA